jgi:hypothetical protein
LTNIRQRHIIQHRSKRDNENGDQALTGNLHVCAKRPYSYTDSTRLKIQPVSFPLPKGQKTQSSLALVFSEISTMPSGTLYTTQDYPSRHFCHYSRRGAHATMVNQDPSGPASKIWSKMGVLELYPFTTHGQLGVYSTPPGLVGVGPKVSGSAELGSVYSSVEEKNTPQNGKCQSC